MAYETIPDEIKNYPQWVVWKLEPRANGKPTKIPYSASTGAMASVTERATWCGFDEACQAANSGAYSGIGFVLTEDDPYTFIDLDVAEGDQPNAEQIKIYKGFQSYSEWSPSGLGLHIIVKGRVPKGKRRGNVEVYSSARYMTMTGNVYNDAPIAEREGLLQILFNEMGGAAKEYSLQESLPQTMSDEDVIHAALSAANGDKVSTLLYGDPSTLYAKEDGSLDWSRADMALVDIIAFYSRNHEQIIRIWRNSQLGARDKANRDAYAKYMLEKCFDNQLSPVDTSHLFKGISNDELPVVIASAFQGKPVPKRQWHADQFIPAHTVTLFGGDGGTGKSLAALQLAFSTAIGRAWFGVAIQQPGGALFLTAEDDIDEVQRRLVDIAASENVELSALNRLAISSLAGLDALMAVPGQGGRTLVPTSVYAALRAHVEAHRPKLIVLDTLADLFGGDEINRAQVRQFVSMLRAIALDFETTVVLLAHPSLTGIANGTGLSGSTAWNNSVRSRLYIERVQDNPDARKLSIMKANYGVTGRTLNMVWRNGVFVSENKAATFAATEKSKQVFLKLLQLFNEQGRHVNPSGGQTYAPNVFANHPNSEGVSKRAFRDAMETLLNRGEIRVEEDGPPSKRRSFIVADPTSNPGFQPPPNLFQPATNPLYPPPPITP